MLYLTMCFYNDFACRSSAKEEAEDSSSDMEDEEAAGLLEEDENDYPNGEEVRVVDISKADYDRTLFAQHNYQQVTKPFHCIHV